MKHVVHNKRERFAALTSMFIAAGVEVGRVSDVKRDGTVIVFFLSTEDVAATEAATRFGQYLTEKDLVFVKVEDTKIRMSFP